MEIKLYCIKDVLVGDLKSPVPMQNDEVAVRALRIAANDPNSFKENKTDIQLWYLCSYDSATGLIIDNTPRCIGNLIDFVERGANDGRQTSSE